MPIEKGFLVGRDGLLGRKKRTRKNNIKIGPVTDGFDIKEADLLTWINADLVQQYLDLEAARQKTEEIKPEDPMDVDSQENPNPIADYKEVELKNPGQCAITRDIIPEGCKVMPAEILRRLERGAVLDKLMFKMEACGNPFSYGETLLKTVQAIENMEKDGYIFKSRMFARIRGKVWSTETVPVVDP